MRTSKTLIRLDGFPGWTETSLGTQVIFFHAAAHLYIFKFIQSEEKIWQHHLQKRVLQVVFTRRIKIDYMSRNMTKPTKWLFTKRRFRSAWASAQSNQSLRCALNGKLRTQAFFMWTAKTLTRLGGCPGWYESSLGAHAILLVLSC